MSSGNVVKAYQVPGGRVVRPASEMDYGVIADIAAEYGLIATFLLAHPDVVNQRAVIDLYKACCKHAEVDPPELITADLIAEAIVDSLDDLPEEYVDGIPKEGDPTTT